MAKKTFICGAAAILLLSGGLWLTPASRPVRAGAPRGASYLLAYLTLKQPGEDTVAVTASLAHGLCMGGTVMHLKEYVFVDGTDGHWDVFSGKVTVTESTVRLLCPEELVKERTRRPFLERPAGSPEKGQALFIPESAVTSRTRVFEFLQIKDIRSVHWELGLRITAGAGKVKSERFTITLVPGSAGFKVTRWWDKKQKREAYTVAGGKRHGPARSWKRDGTPEKEVYWWQGSSLSKADYEKRLQASRKEK